MKKIKIWEKADILKYEYINDIEELIENINTGKISSLQVKNEYIPGTPITTVQENIFLEKNINAIYTDTNHPVCINKLSNETFVDKVFFERHKKRIVEALQNKALNNNGFIIINEYTYSDDFIKKIVENNENIRIEFNEITPSYEIINYLNERHIEATQRINGKQTQISTKYAVQHYTFKNLQTLNRIQIPSTISDEEIKNLSFCHDQMIIEINDNRLEEPEYLNNISKILKKIKDQNIILKFNCNKRSNLEKTDILNSNFENLKIIINNDFYDYPFDEYKKEEERLNDMVKDIKNSNMSPFEKYIAIYNIVKNFKEYKENEEDKTQSRYLRNILDNEYMVCVGYVKLFQTLLDKVGIEAAEYSPNVDISYDEGFTEEEKPLEHAGHARLMVHIIDEQYGINGFYISDPTWDNNLQQDLYANLLMPMDYMQRSQRLFKLQTLDYIFDVHTIDEYNMKINTLIRKSLSQIIPGDKRLFNKSSYSEIEIQQEIEKKYKFDIAMKLQEIYIKIINQIKELDYNKYLELKNKTNDLNSLSTSLTVEELEEKIENYYNFFREIGPYIVSKSNKEVSEETIAEAITASKLKQVQILPQNAEEYRKNLEEALQIQDEKARPYDFPDDYLTETDNGITVIPKKR